MKLAKTWATIRSPFGCRFVCSWTVGECAIENRKESTLGCFVWFRTPPPHTHSHTNPKERSPSPSLRHLGRWSSYPLWLPPSLPCTFPSEVDALPELFSPASIVWILPLLSLSRTSPVLFPEENKKTSNMFCVLCFWSQNFNGFFRAQAGFGVPTSLQDLIVQGGQDWGGTVPKSQVWTFEEWRKYPRIHYIAHFGWKVWDFQTAEVGAWLALARSLALSLSHSTASLFVSFLVLLCHTLKLSRFMFTCFVDGRLKQSKNVIQIFKRYVLLG